MIGNDGLSVADALALRNGNDNDGFGGANGAWWIIILILFYAFGGWGNRGNFGATNGGGNGYNACCVPATAQGVTDAFNFNQLDNGIRGLERGLCDGFYSTSMNLNSVESALQNCCCQTQQAINNASALTQQSIANLGYQVGQGFCGVDKSILMNGYQNQTGFNSIANQLSSCCCDLSRGQENIKYEIAQATNNLLVAADKNTDRIINHLTQTELTNLRNERDEYRSQLQIASQTRSIVDQLLPVARPAYLTCSPYASAFGINLSNSGCNTCC